MSLKNDFSFEGVKIFGQQGCWNVSIKNGEISSIKGTTKSSGGIIIPRFSDIHVHLDKTGTSQRAKRRATSLFDAINLMAEDKINWTEEDIYSRANRALDSAWKNGTGAMRTHVDWETPQIPLAWEILIALKSEWKGRLELQLASLSPLDVLVSHGEEIAKVLKRDDSILGCFVYRNERIDEGIRHLFQLAAKHDVELDFHVDEGLDDDASGLDVIIDEVDKQGFKRKVLCGHACSLAIRDPSNVFENLKKMADFGMGLTTLPTTNLWLQDNIAGRTPRVRGLAPIIEARKAGVDVMIASDNCRDPFYPFGDYSLLSVYKLAVIAAHLEEECWFESISSVPARWMGFDNSIKVGAEASFLWFNVGSFCSILDQSEEECQVWNKGKIINVKC